MSSDFGGDNSVIWPKSWVYPALNELKEFSRNKVRVGVTANTTFNPFDMTVIELPESKLDMNTFSISGNVSTSSTSSNNFCITPSIEEMIASVSLEIGGESITPNMNNNYNQIWNTISTFQGTYNRFYQRKILQLEPGVKNGSNTPPTANQTNVPFQLNNFLGPINDIRLLPTDRLPPVKIIIRWDTPNVCASALAAGGNNSYQITNLKCSVDYITTSPTYNTLIGDRLANGGIKIPFTNYASTIGTVGSVNQSTRWTTSGNCIERVIGTFLSPTYNAPSNNGMNTVTARSGFFTKGPTFAAATAQPNAFTSQFTVNGLPYPTYPVDFQSGDIFLHTLQALNEDKDLTTEQHAGMQNLQLFGQNFFAHAYSFTYSDMESINRMCGLSGAGNLISGMWTTTSSVTSESYLPMIIVQSKSILWIGSGRSIRYIH